MLELEKILVSEGLYEKEAKAMIETWKDSWFEEGLRVFYVLTRKSTDKILPLQVEPKPKETVRVMVGRTEVITPEMEQDVRKQVGLLRSTSAKIRQGSARKFEKIRQILRADLEKYSGKRTRCESSGANRKTYFTWLNSKQDRQDKQDIFILFILSILFKFFSNQMNEQPIAQFRLKPR